MKAEFKIGDKVTFKPYEKAIPATITAVDVYKGRNMWNDDVDDRIFYRLGGGYAYSVTTGKCIMESRLFEPEQPDNGSV